MRGGPDFEVARAFVELFEQIEAGGQPGQQGPSLNRLQRRILERWAGEMRQLNPADSLARAIDVVLSAVSSAKALPAGDRDVLEAYAIGEGPRGRALRRALQVYEGQVDSVLANSPPEPSSTEEINVSDLSELPEIDRAIVARFDAALLGVLPAPGSVEAAAVAAMNRFVNKLRCAAETDPGSKRPPERPTDTFTDMLEHYKARLEQTLCRECNKRGARIVNVHEFDRALIELMQYFHAQLLPPEAHAGIAAFMRGIFEGCGLVSYGNLA